MSANPNNINTSSQEIARDFRAHIAAELGRPIDPHDSIVADRGVHHATVVGDKHPNKLWYCIRTVPYVHGWWGYFYDEIEKRLWEPTSVPQSLSPEDMALLREQARMDAEKEKRRKAEEVKQRRAEVHAEYMAAELAPISHGYFAKKGIEHVPPGWKLMTHRFRRMRKGAFSTGEREVLCEPEDALMIPLRTIASKRVASAQYIAADGQKKSAWGLPMSGACWIVGAYVADQPIYLCEGVATAYDIHRLCGHMTVACMSAGGIKQVAKDARKEWPNARLVICAERGNGHAQALTAAQAVNGQLCEPPWPEEDTEGTDFNDYCLAHGDELTLEALGVFTAPELAPQDANEPSQALREWFDEVNAEFFVVLDWGGQAVIGRDTPNGVVLQDDKSVRLALANRRVPGSDRLPHTSWLSSLHRREYRRAAYDPEWKLLDKKTDLNLWRGFSVEPAPGDWSLMRAHIRDNICSGDVKVDTHLIKLLAYWVQHPGTPSGVAIVLQGEQGVGKGTLANTMLKFFGPHGYSATKADCLSGRFNGHLEQLSLFCADEMSWAGDHALNETMKGLITEPYLDIEHKGLKRYAARNHLNFILSTNKEHAVQMPAGERRMFVLPVRDAFAEFTEEAKAEARDAYFNPLYAQLSSGGYAAMLHDLLALDLTAFKRAAFPRTAAARANVELSLNATQSWCVELARSGWEGPGDKGALYEKYAEHLKRMGRRSEYVDQWAKTMRAGFGPSLKDRQPREKATGFRKREFRLEDPRVARAHMARAWGVTIEEADDE